MTSAGSVTGAPRQLRVSFEASGQHTSGYDVVVRASSGEEERREFRPRISQAHIDAALASSGDEAKPSVRRSGLLESVDPAQDLGGRLFDAVFGGRVGRLYQQEAEAALAEGAPVQFRIASDDPDVAALPWELLYDFSVRNDFIVLCRKWSIVREHITASPPPFRRRPPKKLHALLVTALVEDYPGVIREIADLRALAGEHPELELHIVQHATPQALREALAARQYDVLHFCGNALEQGIEQRLVLAAAGDGDDHVLLDPDDLVAALAPQRALQLVLLNACQTDLLAGKMAQVLPATIGMQGVVNDMACATFARSLYAALLRGEAAGRAVSGARKQIDHDDPGSRQWAMPVLYLPLEDRPLVSRAHTHARRKTAARLREPAAARSADERRAEIELQIATRNLEAMRDGPSPDGGAPAFVAELRTSLERDIARLSEQLAEVSASGHTR